MHLWYGSIIVNVYGEKPHLEACNGFRRIWSEWGDVSAGCRKLDVRRRKHQRGFVSLRPHELDLDLAIVMHPDKSYIGGSSMMASPDSPPTYLYQNAGGFSTTVNVPGYDRRGVGRTLCKQQQQQPLRHGLGAS